MTFGLSFKSRTTSSIFSTHPLERLRSRDLSIEVKQATFSEGALTNMGESGSRAFPNSSSPHFPFEIRMKSAEKNGQIKFNRNLAQNLF